MHNLLCTGRRAAFAVVGFGLLALLSGCGDSAAPTDACLVSPRSPTVLAPAERRAPRTSSSPAGNAIVAWESVTGGPLEAVVRDAGGNWDDVAPISEPAAAAPSVAIDDRGRAVAVWDGRNDDGDRTVVLAQRDARGRWAPPRVIATETGSAELRPRVVVFPNGAGAIVWRTDLDGELMIARGTAGGRWGSGLRLPTGGGVQAAEVAIVRGEPVIVWLQSAGSRRVVRSRAALTNDGWSPPVALSSPAGRASEIALARGRGGTLVATWREDVADRGQRVWAAARSLDGRWTPSPISALADRPRGLPRPPGPQTIGPRPAVGSDGRAVVVWAQRADGRDRALLRVRTDGRWQPARALSNSDQSGWPNASVSSDERVTVVWEDLDGSRLTLRATDAAAGCRRLTAIGDEVASPEVTALADGQSLVVWNGSNFGSIEATVVP